MRALLATCAFLGMVSPGLAWGPEGHVIVAMVAEARLSEPAKVAVRDILLGAPLPTGALFADEYRVSHKETSRWHYVDIPYAESAYDPARDCAVQLEGDCVIAAIRRELERVADEDARVFDRADALKRLVHWVGDIHQPFHAIERDGDEGGNKVTVTFFGEKRQKLHGVWDSGLIGRTGMSVEDYTAHLLKDVVPLVQAQATATQDPIQWAMESHDVAKIAYVDKGADLDQPYFDEMLPLVDKQLATAGIRLANLLEAFSVQHNKAMPKAFTMPGERGFGLDLDE